MGTNLFFFLGVSFILITFPFSFSASSLVSTPSKSSGAPRRSAESMR